MRQDHASEVGEVDSSPESMLAVLINLHSLAVLLAELAVTVSETASATLHGYDGAGTPITVRR